MAISEFRAYRPLTSFFHIVFHIVSSLCLRYVTFTVYTTEQELREPSSSLYLRVYVPYIA